jgi:hypothetical protein
MLHNCEFKVCIIIAIHSFQCLWQCKISLFNMVTHQSILVFALSQLNVDILYRHSVTDDRITLLTAVATAYCSILWTCILYLEIECYEMTTFFFFHGETAPSGPGPPHYQGFMITLRHTTLSRTPLDEWSAQRRDLYLTTHNTDKRQTSLPPVGFEPTIPANEWPQTYFLNHVATGIGKMATLSILKHHLHSSMVM